jgi:hypothetical protein
MDFMNRIKTLDARKGIAVCVAVLGVAILWVAWHEITAPRLPRETPGMIPTVAVMPPIGPVMPAPSSLTNGLALVLQTNIFTSAHIDRYLAKLAAEEAARKAAEEAARKAAEEAARKAAEEAARKAAEEAARKAAQASTQAAAQTPPPPPPPPPKMVDVAYRGMMQRTDGAVLALVSTTPPGTAAFYRVGDSCQGLVITNIRPRQVDFLFKDGSVKTVQPGEAVKVTEVP